MRPPSRVEIHKQARLFDDFFKVDEAIVSHQRVDGTMSPGERQLVFERGDSVALLLLNLDRRSVVVVNQFRTAALVGRRRTDPTTTDGWITEAIAGMIEPNETPKAAAIRETMEETGYKVHDPELISMFFSSPGGASERVFLFFAEAHDVDQVGRAGGVDSEDLQVVHVPLDDLFEQLSTGTIEDPKLAISAFWLQGRLKARKTRAQFIEALQSTVNDLFNRLAISDVNLWGTGGIKSRFENSPDDYKQALDAPNRPTQAPATRPLGFSTVRYRFKEKPEITIGYKTGAIDDIHGISIWVNSENTDMMMDRVIGRTISAKIRLLGANRDGRDNIIEDAIAEALRSAVGHRAHVGIGTVLVTESGALKATHQVQRIFHVATVESGGLGTGIKADPDKLKLCVAKLLARAEEENNRIFRVLLRKEPFRSILIPLLGSGDGGVPVEEAADIVITTAANHLLSLPNNTLREVYFLAFRPRDKAACDRVLERLRQEGTLDRSENDG
jgi:nudix-type nucleoside diphosphatase (YffH/AdpP family)